MYESNGPEVKICGSASHVAEKYLQLARDAQSSGDPVAAENFYQHAEHYFRLIAAAQEQFRQNNPYYQPQQQQQNAQGGGNSGDDDEDGEDDDQPTMGGEPYAPQPQQNFYQREQQQRPQQQPQQQSQQQQPYPPREPQPSFNPRDGQQRDGQNATASSAMGSSTTSIISHSSRTVRNNPRVMATSTGCRLSSPAAANHSSNRSRAMARTATTIRAAATAFRCTAGGAVITARANSP